MAFYPDPSLVDTSSAGCPTGSLPPLYFGRVYHSPDGGCAPVSARTGKVTPPWYGYDPQLATGIAFITLYAICMFVHIALWIRSKRVWLVVLVLGAVGEVIGWAGRVCSGVRNNYTAFSHNAFLCQIIGLTIAPAFLSAAAYGLYTVLVAHIEPSTSRFRPRTLVYIFVGCDIFSLVLQAAGGGIAAQATEQARQDVGTHIMVAGIAFQLASMTIFSCLTLEYLYKVRKTAQWSATAQKTRYLYYGNIVASALIILRGGYRTAELSQGWRGYLIVREGYFLGLDAVPMLLALLVYIAIHPTFTLPKHTPAIQSNAEEMVEDKSSQ